LTGGDRSAVGIHMLGIIGNTELAQSAIAGRKQNTAWLKTN
jgi:hypothetical protein